MTIILPGITLGQESFLTKEGAVDGDRINRRIVEELLRKEVKLTPQRTEIIRILSHNSHPGAREILEKARERIPDMSISTVYYTIGLLKKEGLIKELEFYEMENRYESEMDDHIDLICTGCGNIENFENDGPETRRIIEECTGFKARRMRFEYYGLCKECGSKKA